MFNKGEKEIATTKQFPNRSGGKLAFDGKTRGVKLLMRAMKSKKKNEKETKAR